MASVRSIAKQSRVIVLRICTSSYLAGPSSDAAIPLVARTVVRNKSLWRTKETDHSSGSGSSSSSSNKNNDGNNNGDSNDDDDNDSHNSYSNKSNHNNNKKKKTNHNRNNNDVNDNNNNNNKVAVASAAARGVSFIFGRFFGQKLENHQFCVVFVNKTMFRTLLLL